VQSLFEQTFQQFEWIIVNDGRCACVAEAARLSAHARPPAARSPNEETPRLLEQAALKDPAALPGQMSARVTLITLEKNVGLPAARNMCVAPGAAPLSLR
jgi:hypothetical protein